MTDEQSIPERAGPRPTTGPAMPHQQLSGNAPAPLQEELWRRMSALEGVRTGPSGVSLPETRALHLDSELAAGPPEAFMVGTEFAHLHGPADGSLHMALPPDLAQEAIARGWAELHPLARAGRVPETLVMVYGPRDDEELETVWRLVAASYANARGRYSPSAGGT
ncbi:MAG TPA: luciferase family protein [Solirubrobacterales bacterium]|nr:luciferase family protein [Solirubrobacterales bacterium]